MRGNIALLITTVFILVVIGFAIGVAYTDSSQPAEEKQGASYTLYYAKGKSETPPQKDYSQASEPEKETTQTSVSQTVNVYTTYHTPAFYYPYPKVYYFYPYPYYHYYPKYYPKPIPKYPPKPPHVPRYPYSYGMKYYTFS